MRSSPRKPAGRAECTDDGATKRRSSTNGLYCYSRLQARYASFHPFSKFHLKLHHAGTTTGISAHDRSLTARALASPTVLPSDFIRPGHLVPLRARDGGITTRRGHTEAAVDLCLFTKLPQAGVLCELVNDDAQGTMARRDDCRAFADRWGLKMISVEMLAEWKRTHFGMTASAVL